MGIWCATAPVPAAASGQPAPALAVVALKALGRPRGGLTTEVHLAVDGRGLPLSIVLTPGNVNDATAFGQVIDSMRIPRASTGRPRTRPDRVLGGKAYSSRAIRRSLRRRGVAVTISERCDRTATGLRQTRRPLPRRHRPGRPDRRLREPAR